jgi:hypothetical protein
VENVIIILNVVVFTPNSFVIFTAKLFCGQLKQALYFDPSYLVPWIFFGFSNFQHRIKAIKQDPCPLFPQKIVQDGSLVESKPRGQCYEHFFRRFVQKLGILKFRYRKLQLGII